MIIRPIALTDLNALCQLSQQVGYGMSSLAADPQQLNEMIENSQLAFNTPSQQKAKHSYVFAMQPWASDGQQNQDQNIVGVCGIKAESGQSAPFYSYRLSNITQHCQALGIKHDIPILMPSSDYSGSSLICTLFLSEKFRKNSNGRFLSFVRFLFAAQFSYLFQSKFIAEMRGVCNEQGVSPFWQAIGQHFFKMSFAQADKLCVTKGTQFINDLLPNLPIFVPTLTKEAQKVIGQVHKQTLPALKLLKSEGFRYTGYVDVFDAGPMLEVDKSAIRTLVQSQVFQFNATGVHINSPTFMLCNTHLQNFRACMGPVTIKEHEIFLSKACAQQLALEKGDQVRISPLHQS